MYDTYVILVDTPISGQSFAESNWYSHLRRNSKIHGVYFVVDAKKQLIGGGLLLGSLESPDGIWTSTDFAITASDANHMEGAGKLPTVRLPQAK